jgi:hypothetical protein
VKRVETLVTLEGSDAAPRYVGVWGTGGVGKTLLLQTLYGSRKVQGHFQRAEFIWLTVGQTPDIMALYGMLSKELGLKPELNANPEDYKLKLHSQFKQKRVFLVLDDVWQDEAFDSLDLAKGKGSVTLLTTRNQSLLKRAKPPISQVHMTPLSKESYLFCVHAFRPPSNVPCELKALAQCMPEECQGVPLALKVQLLDPAMSGAPSSSITNTDGPYTQVIEFPFISTLVIVENEKSFWHLVCTTFLVLWNIFFLSPHFTSSSSSSSFSSCFLSLLLLLLLLYSIFSSS